MSKENSKKQINEDLRKWVKEKWVDIGAPDGKGGYKPCGRSKGEKRKGYPKCVPSSKASSMSKGQKTSAVKRKRAAGNSGPKPTMVKTKMREQRMQSIQEKLCPKGKAAAKRKFKVYPSAYANLYGSAVCSGKVTPGGKKKKKKNESSTYQKMGSMLAEMLGLIKEYDQAPFPVSMTAKPSTSTPISKLPKRKGAKGDKTIHGETPAEEGKPPHRREQENSHTVYQDMGMMLAEMRGLIKKAVKAVGTKIADSGSRDVASAETGEASGESPEQSAKTMKRAGRKLKLGQAIKSLGGD